MPHLCITAGQNGPELHGQGSVGLERLLRSALAADPGPITVMIHGYKYQPGHPRHCPHRSLLSDRPSVLNPRIVSWPRRLGLRGQRGEGLRLSFGWNARGAIWRAFDAAVPAGAALQRLIAMLGRAAPGRPIRLIAHSLGVRVALEALRRGAPRAVQKAILLAGAEFHQTARAALQAAGAEGCEVLNVTSRENDLYDFLLERLVLAPAPKARALGAAALGLGQTVTVQIDDAESLRALRALGFPIAPPAGRVCHWSPYLRAGVFPLYRAFLADRVALADLQRALPAQIAPRWSRFAPPRSGAAPGLAGKALP